ncbi:kinetochore protein Nuf2, partial [Tremellales sp. Uapishka_1]
MSQPLQKSIKQIEDENGFTICNASTLVQLLAALGIIVNLDDITKPTPASVQAIWAGLLDTLMGAPIDLLEQPKAALMGMMEYKELYSDALQFTMFFRHCSQLALTCKAPNFNMTDLTRPDAMRLRISLSAVMNFAKFREERVDFMADLHDKMREQQERTHRLRRQLDKVEADIKEITLRNAADRPATLAAEKRNTALRAEIQDFVTERVAIGAEWEELKTERQALYDKLSARQIEKGTLEHQVATSRSRIVQSPERIKRQITDMQARVAEEKAIHASHLQSARDLKTRLDIISVLEVDLKGLIDLEKGVEGDRAKVENARRNMMNLRSKLESLDIEYQGCSARLEQLSRLIQNANDKVSRRKNVTKDTAERHAQTMESLKAEYKERCKQRSIHQKELDVLVAEQKELEGEMAAFVGKNESAINDLLKEYWGMRRQAEDYMNTITHKLGLDLEVAA